MSSFRVTLGVLVQLHERLAVSVRTGLRNQGSAWYVPLGADLLVSLLPWLDLGATFDLAGHIAPANGIGYSDRWVLNVFAVAHV
jgi:hypothetical protein